MFEISHIHNGIHISSLHVIKRPEILRRQGIQAILRLDNQDRQEGQWPQEFELLDLPFPDAATIPAGYIEKSTRFIHEQVSQNRKVLVHCHMGISRSVTMVMAYLIEYENMNLEAAYELVHNARRIAYPHPVLVKCLVERYNLPYERDQVLKSRFLEGLLKHDQSYS